MTLTLLKNMRPTELPESLSMVVATPKPRLVKLKISAAGNEPFSTGSAGRTATHYAVKIDIGGLTGLIAPLIGKQPPDTHVWILQGAAPAFVKSEGPMFLGGPIWRIEARGGECWLVVIGECRRRSAKAGPFCNPPYLAPSAQPRSIAGTGKLMSSRLHEVAKDICLAELLAGLETVQALHQDVTLAVLAHQDRHLQAILQYAFSDLLRFPRIEHGAPFRRYVDVRNSECLALHHGTGSLPIQSAFRYSKFQHAHAAAAVAAALDGSRLIRCGAKTISASIAAPASHIRWETP
jgi:hypothetical protein